MGFLDIRKNGRININDRINDGTIIIDEIETRGARKKFWFNNHEFMYKEIYDNTYEDFAEIIAFEIAKELGIDCAYYDIASFDGKCGVITKSIVDEKSGEEMISGGQVIKDVYFQHILPILNLKKDYYAILDEYNSKYGSNYKQYSLKIKKDFMIKLIELYHDYLSYLNLSIPLVNDYTILNDAEMNRELDNIFEVLNDITGLYDEDFIDYEKGIIMSNNLFDLWSVLDNYCKISGYEIENVDLIMKKLTDLFIYDIITSQIDRHAENWSIIINKRNKSIRFAPIYDNSNMCNLNRGNAVETIDQLINSLGQRETSYKKRERILSRIRKTIFHANSSLKIDPEDVKNKKKNPYLMEKFINVSSSEVVKDLKEKLNKISPETIEEIYQRIEDRIGIPIPDVVKTVVSFTIKNNIEEFHSYINLFGGKII